MTKKEIRRIRKYAKLRAGNEPALQYKVLRKVYENASDMYKKMYIKEMEQYFEAVKSGRIEKGQSILHSVAH